MAGEQGFFLLRSSEFAEPRRANHCGRALLWLMFAPPNPLAVGVQGRAPPLGVHPSCGPIVGPFRLTCVVQSLLPVRVDYLAHLAGLCEFLT
jgi:hypothetical protein